MAEENVKCRSKLNYILIKSKKFSHLHDNVDMISCPKIDRSVRIVIILNIQNMRGDHGKYSEMIKWESEDIK